MPPQKAPNVDPHSPTSTHRLAFILKSLITLTIIVVGSFYYFNSAPTVAHYPIILEVEPGMSVRAIASLAKEMNVVRSELMLYALLTSLNDPTNIHAGRYHFEQPSNSIAVAKKIATNDVDELLISITIPEGVTVERIAQIAEPLLPNFNSAEFIALAKDDEGFLFPETYFVPEAFTAADLYALQTKTFAERLRPIEEGTVSTTPEETRERIILASIIEREANDETSMGLVSGILQNRLQLGMPLQADATIEYVLDTPLNELEPGELAQYLKELDSPYNTYLYKGLPPTPIGNPGLTAINAAFNPTPSEYLYYLTDENGVFYYAETLTEHNNNVANHLR